MKRKIHLAVWSAVTAITVSALTFPAVAAQGDTTGSLTTQKDKTFGHVERENKLIGKTVISSDNQKLGKIDNFVVDLMSGHILYVVVGSGGVLGAGEHRYALAPEVFTETAGNDAHISIDKAKFSDAPQFSKDMEKEGELGKADFVSKVYQHCGQNFWWQGSKPANEGSFNNVHLVNDLVGMKVKNVSDEPVGKIENVALDVPAGRVVYVIFTPDSSFNLGNNFYALPPDALTLGSDKKMLVSDITKDKLAGAPHFAKDNWQQLSDQSFASQVYQYYGKQAYFQTGSPLRPTGRNIKNP
jgi:sporulation protein YlmC with PRC-barrel domain